MSVPMLCAFVHTLRFEAQDTISVELRPVSSGEFPAFTPGSHLDLHLPNQLVRSYSLSNDSGERDRYVLGVLRDRASRGGSRYVHESLRVGMTLDISAPRNHFALDEDATHTVLVAGGIGITPLLCMARRLKSLGRSFELLYFTRERAGVAFLDELNALGMPLHLHVDAQAGGPPDLRALLARFTPDAGTHYYACGPAPMLDVFEQCCAELKHVNTHIERFAPIALPPSKGGRSHYTVQLKRSGRCIQVSPDKSLLDTLREAGVEVDHSCCEGVCGSCETPVLAGVPEHRDAVLSPGERASNKVMMVCVSGSKSETLTLDL